MAVTVLQEHLEDAAGLLVDQPGDALDAATAGQSADGRLSDAVALGAPLSETLASLAAARPLFVTPR